MSAKSRLCSLYDLDEFIIHERILKSKDGDSNSFSLSNILFEDHSIIIIIKKIQTLENVNIDFLQKPSVC